VQICISCILEPFFELVWVSRRENPFPDSSKGKPNSVLSLPFSPKIIGEYLGFSELLIEISNRNHVSQIFSVEMGVPATKTGKIDKSIPNRDSP
jgi:hypothetical protein